MAITITYPDSQEYTDISFDDIISNTSYTVLFFYPKDNTPGCSLEAKAFSSCHSDFMQKDCQVIGISSNNHVSHLKFIDKCDLSIPLISDLDKEIHEDDRFQARKEKSMFGKKYMGTQRSTFVLNQNGDILKSWPKVSIKGHVKAVLEFVQSL